MNTAALMPMYTGCHRCYHERITEARQGHSKSPAVAKILLNRGANDPLLRDTLKPFQTGWYHAQAIVDSMPSDAPMYHPHTTDKGA